MKILIGVDGSEQADTALRWGLREARLHDAAVTVVHAIPVHGSNGGTGRAPYAQQMLAAHELLAKALARAAIVDDGGIEVDKIAVVDDVPARVLLERARECDLVVVGSRGRGGFAGLLLGSVSQQVSAHAPVPVAVVPTDRGEDRRPDRESVREIVVGVDGSPHSVDALRWGLREADVRHCPLTAVYVYPNPAATLTADVVAGVNQLWSETFYARTHDVATRKLDELIAREVPAAGRAAVERNVIAGAAASALVDEAADPATMLVLGSRGRGGFAGLLLGSVTQQCLHHARGPVVVVHRTPAAEGSTPAAES